MEQYEHESERRGLSLQRVLGDDRDRRAALVAIAVTAVVVVALVIAALLIGADGPWWFYALLAIIGGLTLVLAARNVRVWVAWGNPQLFLPSSEDLRLGDRVTLRFRRRARAGIDPSAVALTARLVCEEHVRSNSGVVRTGTVFDRPVEIVVCDRDLATIEADLLVEVPLYDASPTFELTHYAVGWRLEVRLVAAGAPDDDSTFPLMIAPAVSQRLAIGDRR